MSTPPAPLSATYTAGDPAPADPEAVDTVLIPRDGAEHDCICGGASGYRADHDGDYTYWTGEVTVRDDEGRAAGSCHSCDRELEVAPEATA